MSRVRVLVVDDSAFARKVLSRVLLGCEQIEVVGTATDGLDALEKIAELDPDVLTLDLVMPQLDGLGLLVALVGRPRPKVVVVSMSDAHSELGVRALAAGAVDLVHKPTALATERLYELGDELVQKVLVAASARPYGATGAGLKERGGALAAAAVPVGRGLAVPSPEIAVVPPPSAARPSSRRVASNTEIVVLGTSTGGPHALTRIVPQLPADLPVPLVIALHIPAEYTGALAERLDRASPLRVVEGKAGQVLEPGTVVLAPGGVHVSLRRRGHNVVVELSPEPRDALYRPSVDVLFESAARAYGAGVLGVVLTGMGEDGLRGSGHIAARGGRIITEAAASCVIHGMPRAVLEAGLSHDDVVLDDIVPAILRHL